MSLDWGLKGKELRALQRDLKSFGKKEFAVINGMALNRTAFEARVEYVKTVKRIFTLRNRWTERSIRFQKVRGFTNQFSEVGSIMNYMEDQEFGKTKTATGRKGVAIPSNAAANVARGTRPRPRRVLPSRQRNKIRLHKASIKSKNRRQHVVATVQAAIQAKGRQFVYLPRLGKMTEGIYLISGGKKRPKIDLMYDLSRKSVKINASRPLNTTVDRIRPQMPIFYRQAFERRVAKKLNK
jgi:hypothetical protein